VHYAEATRFLYALAPRGVMLGLSRVEDALALRGHPERKVPAVLIAGTNGKGSVASMIESVLRADGYRTGLYTSPHLHRMTERFRIDGKPVGQRDFAARVTNLAPFFEHPSTPALTFFEACTLLAFEIFRDARCDIMVLEVGLGGRLDATNVVTPLVSAITGIALDHQDRLGSTIAKIAREKAGIINASVPVVVGARDSAALRVIHATAKRRGAPLLRVGREISVSSADDKCDVEVAGRAYRGLTLALAGSHQRDNLACAVAVIDRLEGQGLPVSERALRRGIARTRWPGRLELLPGKPDVLFDAAHNPEACEKLAQHLATMAAKYRRRVLLFGVMRDKDHATMLATLRPHVNDLVFATPDTPRAESAGRLRELYQGLALEDPSRAFSRAKKLAGARGLVIVAGSIFLLAKIRAEVLGLGMDPTIAM